MRFDSVETVRRLVADHVAESPSLEFKRELVLDSRGQRLEMLKDLTAMANGGGGSLLFGIDEAEGDWPEAAGIRALVDRGLVSRLEDTVRDGVQPPLLYELYTVEVDDGFVLVADVQPSPLGPNMVVAYGHYRYHRRIGRRTEPMSEQQVRDAYALALRGRDTRPDLWKAHHLPMPPLSDEPWMIVSALPEEPLADIVDLGSLDPGDVRPPRAVQWRAEVAQFNSATDRLGRWADGLFGHDGFNGSVPYASVRLHRDGAAALARRLGAGTLPEVYLARLVNAQIAYLTWFWTKFDLRRPVEIRLELTSLSSLVLETGQWVGLTQTIHQPPGVPGVEVVVTDHVLPWELARASNRHRLVQRFVDRLHHAFGKPFLGQLFRSGQLYGESSHIGFAVAGRGVWTAEGRVVAYVQADGSVVSAVDGRLAAWWLEGCLIDLDGNTLGVVEMGPGLGVPDDFLPSSLLSDPRARVPNGDAGQPFGEADRSAPAPTGAWAETRDLAQVFAPVDVAGDGT